MNAPVSGLPPASPPETIGTARLLLRKHELELAEQMFVSVEADRERLGRFLPWVDHVRSVEDEKAYISRTHRDWDAHEMFDYGIFAAEDGRYLGNVGVHHLEWAHARCEIGYWLIHDAEGRGFMTEAVRALEEALFTLGMHRIEIRCSTLNDRSAGVPTRLGYRLEGTLRDWMIERGAFRDVKIFGKLRSESASRAVSGPSV